MGQRDPCTMQNEENLKHDDVCKDVASELYSRLSGILVWRIMNDPGLGFSKKDQNLDIFMGLSKEIAKKSIAVSHAPSMVGHWRKRFLGDICGQHRTVASVTAGILGGANTIRVRNVRDNVDSARLCDAMLRRGSS